MIFIDFDFLRNPYCKNLTGVIQNPRLTADIGTVRDSVIWTFLQKSLFRFIVGH